MIELDPLITAYEHEKHRPKETDALKTLRKVASLVKPIMRQRGWRVGTLTEFWPTEKNLLGLNWNSGQKICLRLRSPFDERQFIPMEQVVDTMLHELCHNVIGPHNDEFHKLWNQLREEYEQLVRKGYNGEGFLTQGHQLGGSKRIPLQEARRRARAAAEKRAALSAGAGRRLGGTDTNRSQEIRKVIADATTRRITVLKGCGIESDRKEDIMEEASRNGFRTKAEEEDANEQAIMQAYIELIQEEDRERYGKEYIPPSKAHPAGSQGQISTGKHQAAIKSSSNSSEATDSSLTINGRASTSAKANRSSNSMDPKAPPEIHDLTSNSCPFDSWTCGACTLHNLATYLCCDACGLERPTSERTTTEIAQATTAKPLPSRLQPRKSLSKLASLYEAEKKKPLGWLCHACGNYMETEWWTCAGCGTMKLSS